MIKSFKEFLNESLSYSKLVKFGITEFQAGELEQVGEDVLRILSDSKCVLIDSNGDEDEFEVYERLLSIAAGQEKNSVVANYEMDQDQDYAVMTYYDKFPVLGKAIKVSRGRSHFEAANNEEFMFFLPTSFRPDKFMESTEGHETGKQYGV
jgi:hypothetical protein